MTTNLEEAKRRDLPICVYDLQPFVRQRNHKKPSNNLPISKRLAALSPHVQVARLRPTTRMLGLVVITYSPP